MASSTISTQSLIDYARVFPWAIPVTGVAGYGLEPALSFANDVMQKIISQANPWKWNSNPVPIFYTQPYQQDYPTNISQNVMGWLESATLIDINNTQSPKPQPPVLCVARLLPVDYCGVPTEICWVPNTTAIFGVWPGNNQVYTDPVTNDQTGIGGPANNPVTAIIDPNGNIQLVTTYGTTLAAGVPNWPAAGATVGTTTPDGTVVWTLMDPNGVSIRLNALATNESQVFQITPIYQQKPPVISTLSQTFAPIPDDLGYLIKQGFMAYCSKIVDRQRFNEEFPQWLADIQEAMVGSDREPQEYSVYPAESLQGTGSTQPGGYSYVGWEGWRS